jgi:hypothetical protein
MNIGKGSAFYRILEYCTNGPMMDVNDKNI